MIPYTPPEDNKKWILEYQGTNGGVCGPACLATLGKTSITAILDRWLGRNGSFKGYTPLSEMMEMLKLEGWSYKRRIGHGSRKFPKPESGLAVVRIQWLMPDGRKYFWAAAGSHTHYVLSIREDNGEWFVLCNEQGWFMHDGPTAEQYLKNGYIGSYLELSRPKP